MTITIYPQSALNVYRKTKLAYPPAIDAICDEIYKACAGVGTDEAALVKYLGPKSADERAMIGYRYKEKYEQTLRELVKGETSGDFGYLLQMLAMNLPDAESHVLYHAMAGVGTTDNLIYPVVLGRTNEELAVLKKAFFAKYEKDLTVMIDGELSGDYHTIITTAMQEVLIDFKDSFHTSKKAEEDADTLYKSGDGKWGTDTKNFVKILLAMPAKHLKNVDKIYKEKYGHGLVQAIQNEFSGSSSESLTFFVRMSLEPFELIADQIIGAMDGIGTDENKLSMMLVRYHPYLNKVKPIFESKFKISLRERVHSEVNGKYRDLLLNVIDAPVSHGAVA